MMSLFTPFHPFNPPDPATTTLLTMDYCGSHVYRNGALERTVNDCGSRAQFTHRIIMMTEEVAACSS